MRRIPLFAFVLLLLLPAGHGILSAGSGVHATPAILDFGQVRQGEVVEVQFVLENSGDRSRTIRFIDFSRPALFAQVSPRVEPGASNTVQVRWNTANLSGPVEGEITLDFEGPGGEPVVVTIRGTVLPAENAHGD